MVKEFNYFYQWQYWPRIILWYTLAMSWNVFYRMASRPKRRRTATSKDASSTSPSIQPRQLQRTLAAERLVKYSVKTCMTQFMSIIDNYFHKRGVPGSSHSAQSAEVYNPGPSNAMTLLSDIIGGTFGSTTTQLPYRHKLSLTSPIGIIFDIRG